MANINDKLVTTGSLKIILQKIKNQLDAVNSIIIESNEDWNSKKEKIFNSLSFGKFIYIGTKINDETYGSFEIGIYVVGLNASSHGNPILIPVDSNDELNSLLRRIENMEKFQNENYLSTGEIENITGIDYNHNDIIGN